MITIHTVGVGSKDSFVLIAKNFNQTDSQQVSQLIDHVIKCYMDQLVMPHKWLFYQNIAGIFLLKE